MSIIKKLTAGMLVIMLGLLLIPAQVSASQVITLEQAKVMAREHGNDYQMLELGFLLAEASYISMRRNLGLGIRESQEIGEDLDGLRGEVEQLNDRIAELREQIREWEDALEQLDEEVDEEEIELMEIKIREARNEKEALEDERADYGWAISKVINRYHTTKALEDSVKPQIRPVEQQVERAEDAMKTMPRVLDYNVDGTYFGLMTLDLRKDILETNRVLLEKTLNHVRIMQELGMNTDIDVSRIQENLRQLDGAISELQAEEENVRRIFRNFLGLHSDTSFELQPLEFESVFTDELPREQFPNLTRSVAYQRALENLERKQDDLEDTSTRDVEDYRRAVLEVENARISLENKIKSLEDNYASKRDRLQVADEKIDNKLIELENARITYRHADIRCELGLITMVQLEQAEIALLEAELNYQQAQQEKYLAQQAYLMARDGIEI